MLNYQDKDIYIYLDSTGGDVQSGNKFIEALDYYKMKNVQADTDMRDSISKLDDDSKQDK